MKEVATNPMGTEPLGFTVLRVPFFLEPGYSRSEEFSESNYDRLVRKWGGKAEFEAQKQRHGLKQVLCVMCYSALRTLLTLRANSYQQRGQEVGILHFKLDRIASNTFASHRLVQVRF